MVRLFIYLFKLDIHRLKTAAEIFQAAMKRFNMHGTPCPECKTKRHFSSHDKYVHHLVDYYNNKVQEGSVEIKIIRCKSCKRKNTYAVLPDLFVPHKSYSILYIMLVLRAVMLRTESVAAVCRRYGVAVSTYYRWKKRYCTYKSLNLGALEKYFYEKDPHLLKPVHICFTNFLYKFYKRYGFSFLQHSKTAESRSP